MSPPLLHLLEEEGEELWVVQRSLIVLHELTKEVGEGRRGQQLGRVLVVLKQ